MKVKGRMRTNFLLFFCTVLVLACANACKKEEARLGVINVRLTDAPANLTAVNLDIQKVKVHLDESHPKADWVELNTKAGIYDVLKLNNGIDALIASGEFPVGNFDAFTIELGTNNTVVVGGVTYPLQFTNGSAPKITIDMRDHVDEGEELTVLIDLDIARSVRFEGDGYIIDPVINAVNLEQCGSVKGKVTPGWTYPVVYAISGPDTTSAYPNADGDFMIRGLTPGMYKVLVQPMSPYQEAVVPNVSVQAAELKDVGIIEVHQ